jgi:uncharacterized phage infection (PIP) family protein YhgE
MSFLDRVTKAVGDAVDRGKKEVDQFMRIQKINGLIGESEKKISQCEAQIQQVKLDIGEHAVQMLRAGTLTSPELQAMVDQIAASEQQVAAEQSAILEKKAEIEKIKAEDQTPAAGQAEGEAPDAAASAAPAAAPVPSQPAVAGSPFRFCPQCGAPASGSGSFCMQCGARLTVSAS